MFIELFILIVTIIANALYAFLGSRNCSNALQTLTYSILKSILI